MGLSFFQGKKVLITGHTGFKGSWLSVWLSQLDADVIGLSNSVPSKPSHYEYIKGCLSNDLREDIRDADVLKSVVQSFKPDFIFHLAAQPIVRASYEDPLVTWETNVLGTINVLEALRTSSKPCFAVFITSDKCYKNVEWTWGYRENDRLGGPDPYSASKGAAEIAINSYKQSFFNSKQSLIRIASARAGNVIGGGDWAKDRIVPDCVRSWSKGELTKLRNPHSTRPWQHVLEPLSGYLTLAKSLQSDSKINGEPFNFGPHSVETYSVLNLVREMSKYWDQVQWKENLSNKSELYESSLLKLNCDKALHLLDWHSCLSFQETIKFTVDWYKTYNNNPSDIFNISKDQISQYINLARMRGLNWAQ